MNRMKRIASGPGKLQLELRNERKPTVAARRFPGHRLHCRLACQVTEHIPGVSLVAVCDKDLARARTFGERYGVTRCHDAGSDARGPGAGSTPFTCSCLPICMLEPHVGSSTRVSRPAGEAHGYRRRGVRRAVERAGPAGVKIGVNHNFLFAPVYEALEPTSPPANWAARPCHDHMEPRARPVALRPLQYLDAPRSAEHHARDRSALAWPTFWI